ncbi:unnamed protein product [Sphagnum compactum]
MENTWGMRNENAAALDSESRIRCLDPDSRISCLMQELLTSRQLASASSHRRARCSVLEIPHRLATNSFAKVGRAFLFRTDSWVCSASACCVDGEISCASSFHVLLYVILFLQRIAGWRGVGWGSGRAPSERLEHSPGIRIASVGRWS